MAEYSRQTHHFPHGSLEPHITNADRIRMMSDEELEKFLLEFEYHESNLYCMKLNSCTYDDPCADCLHEWLKKEVEDG